MNLNEINVEIWVESSCFLCKLRCKGLNNNVWNLILISLVVPLAHFRPISCGVGELKNEVRL